MSHCVCKHVCPWSSFKGLLSNLFIVQALAFMCGCLGSMFFPHPFQLHERQRLIKLATPHCLSWWGFPSHIVLWQAPGPPHRELAQLDRHWQQQNWPCEVLCPQELSRDSRASDFLEATVRWRFTSGSAAEVHICGTKQQSQEPHGGCWHGFAEVGNTCNLVF